MPSLPADPTINELKDAHDLNGIRISIALKAAKDIQKRILPGWIEAARTDFIGCKHLPDIQAWQVAGEKLHEEFPILIVSGSIDIDTLGIGGFAGKILLSISVLYSPSASQAELFQAQDLASLARTVMLSKFAGGYKDEDDQICWDQAIPQGEHVTPIEWKEGRGWSSKWSLDQYPGSPRWARTP